MSRWRRQLHRRHRLRAARVRVIMQRIGALLSEGVEERIFSESLFPRMLRIERELVEYPPESGMPPWVTYGRLVAGPPAQGPAGKKRPR